MTNKLINIEKLSRYHDNLKEVLNTKEAAGAAAQALADAKADAANLYQVKGNYEEAGAAAAAQDAAQKYADGLAVNYDEAGAAADAFDAAKEYADGLAGNYDASGSAATAEQNAKDYADDLVKNEDGSVKFDDKGAAAAAQTAAQNYADGLAGNYDAAGTAAGLNAAMDERVVKLEAIDHDKIVADAIAAVVAGAESDFDTLKEVADWINSDTTGAAALQIKVTENAEAITDLTNDKQDNIDDLETIRSGAAAGATALQADDLEYATNDDIDGLFA